MGSHLSNICRTSCRTDINSLLRWRQLQTRGNEVSKHPENTFCGVPGTVLNALCDSFNLSHSG